MIDKIVRSIKRIKQYPQLVYTFFIAILILGAFILVISQFSRIAIDAQTRLINVRVGSIQDTLSSFTVSHIEEQQMLATLLQDIAKSNSTIQEFNIVRLFEKRPYIYASLYPNKVGLPDEDHQFLFSIASSDPSTSFTIEESSSSGRRYMTAKALVAPNQDVIGYLYTLQSLSEADRLVNKSINQSIIVFSFAMILMMFLFLRHAKIVDYMSLYRKLKEVDELKDDFISMASHELRAPLTAIRGYADLVKDDKNLSSETGGYINRIDISAKHLDTLVSDMLDVSRIEQGRMKFELKLLHPKDLINDIVTLFNPKAQEKGLDISTEITSEAAIMVDEARLRQIVTNLISNAIKYTLQGHIKVKTYADLKKYYISISDTGIGLNAEDQKKLFQKFSRIQTEQTATIRGTGLGLWITQKIVEAMEGQISVESIKGTGSTFIVEFPVIDSK